MNIIYILTFVLALVIELSIRCNTSNLIKKTGLAAIMVGCLVHLAGKGNYLIEIGVLLMLLSECCKAFTATTDRRASDHLPKKRKILS